MKLFNDSSILLSDATLRDGSHAVAHQLTKENVRDYCKLIDKSGVAWVEVGHGNGLGASSIHIGLSKETDLDLLSTARENLTRARLSVHVIPGIASINRDVAPAIGAGVDIFRVGSHCSEADTTLRYLEYVRENNKTAVGVLMMSHMLNSHELVKQAQLMESAGAEAVVVMDSAGAMRMSDVKAHMRALSEGLSIPIGMHAHNNLGLAIGNSIVAVEEGAKIIDACAAGFGAGAGNAAIEILIPLLNEMGVCDIEPKIYFKAVDFAVSSFASNRPVITTGSIATGTAGLFSGFLKPIILEASRNGIDEYDLIKRLGTLNLVAGQEDVIIEIARQIRAEDVVEG